MATTMHPTVWIFSLIFIFMSHFFFPLSDASFLLASSSIPPPAITPHDQACNNTPFPDFCKSFLPQNNSANIHDYGRFSLRNSLSRTRNLLSLVNNFLTSRRQSLPETTVRALQDCQFLLGLNLDFLSDVANAVQFSNTPLQTSEADDKHTLLDATLTNHQTCLDGLQAASLSNPDDVKNTVLTPLSNESMAYSVSLSLFRQGWVPDGRAKKGRRLTERKFPFASVFESIRGRKLLQAGGYWWQGVNVSQMVVVNPDGSRDFTTISDAVAAAPNNTKNAGQGYFVIYVVAGVYNEYVSIGSNKKYLMMVGDGINQTIITGNHSVADGWTTFNSATFAVTGQGFVAVNITIRNTAGAIKSQAVALRTGADLSTFYRCSFEGYQDTLYTHSLRQFYKNCDIYGTVDFIFGNAAVVFQSCNIYPRLPLRGQFNAITAQGRTDINQNTGTSIQNCTITAAADLASSNGTTQTFLGRPWKQYSRAVYLQSFMDSLIDPAGWAAWSGDFALNTSYYAEFANYGPGSNTSNRVTWPGYHVINATDAVNFTVSNFISGDYWLPYTKVPYTGGLF